MVNTYTNETTYKKIKIIFYFFLFFFITFIGINHFLAYKIKKESEKVLLIHHQNYIKRDIHTLCMLDYMINPNGKSILEDCKRIDIKQTKIDTPYLDFYFKYIK